MFGKTGPQWRNDGGSVSTTVARVTLVTGCLRLRAETVESPAHATDAPIRLRTSDIDDLLSACQRIRLAPKP